VVSNPKFTINFQVLTADYAMLLYMWTCIGLLIVDYNVYDAKRVPNGDLG